MDFQVRTFACFINLGIFLSPGKLIVTKSGELLGDVSEVVWNSETNHRPLNLRNIICRAFLVHHLSVSCRLRIPSKLKTISSPVCLMFARSGRGLVIGTRRFFSSSKGRSWGKSSPVHVTAILVGCVAFEFFYGALTDTIWGGLNKGVSHDIYISSTPITSFS